MKKITLISLLVSCMSFFGNSCFAQIPFNENYATNTGWTAVGAGMTVASGVCNFNNVPDGADNRVWRPLGATLSNNAWTAEFEITPNGGNIPAHEVFSLTAGNLAPFGSGPFTPNTQDNIGVALGTTAQQLRVLFKDENVLTGDPATVPIIIGTTYFVRLSRLSPTDVLLEVFSDPARTINVPGSPICVAIPATIINN